MSFADKLGEAVRQVLREHDLAYLRLDNEIIIPSLTERVPVELVIDRRAEDADILSGPKSVNLLIDLPSIIATGEPVTVETFKSQIVSQLGALGIIPRRIFVNQIAVPVVGEGGETVLIGLRDVSGEETVLVMPRGGLDFLVGELTKLQSMLSGGAG